MKKFYQNNKTKQGFFAKNESVNVWYQMFSTEWLEHELNSKEKRNERFVDLVKYLKEENNFENQVDFLTMFLVEIDYSKFSLIDILIDNDFIKESHVKKIKQIIEKGNNYGIQHKSTSVKDNVKIMLDLEHFKGDFFENLSLQMNYYKEQIKKEKLTCDDELKQLKLEKELMFLSMLTLKLEKVKNSFSNKEIKTQKVLNKEINNDEIVEKAINEDEQNNLNVQKQIIKKEFGEMYFLNEEYKSQKRDQGFEDFFKNSMKDMEDRNILFNKDIKKDDDFVEKFKESVFEAIFTPRTQNNMNQLSKNCFDNKIEIVKICNNKAERILMNNNFNTKSEQMIEKINTFVKNNEDSNLYYGVNFYKANSKKSTSKNNFGTNILALDLDLMKHVKKEFKLEFFGENAWDKDSGLYKVASFLNEKIQEKMQPLEVKPLFIATGHGIQILFFNNYSLFDTTKDQHILKSFRDLAKVTIANLDTYFIEEIEKNSDICKYFKNKLFTRQQGLIDFNALCKPSQLMRLPETNNVKDNQLTKCHLMFLFDKDDKLQIPNFIDVSTVKSEEFDLINEVNYKESNVFHLVKYMSEKLKDYQEKFIKKTEIKKEEKNKETLKEISCKKDYKKELLKLTSNDDVIADNLEKISLEEKQMNKNKMEISATRTYNLKTTNETICVDDFEFVIQRIGRLKSTNAKVDEKNDKQQENESIIKQNQREFNNVLSLLHKVDVLLNGKDKNEDILFSSNLLFSDNLRRNKVINFELIDLMNIFTASLYNQETLLGILDKKTQFLALLAAQEMDICDFVGREMFLFTNFVMLNRLEENRFVMPCSEQLETMLDNGNIQGLEKYLELIRDENDKKFHNLKEEIFELNECFSNISMKPLDKREICGKILKLENLKYTFGKETLIGNWFFEGENDFRVISDKNKKTIREILIATGNVELIKTINTKEGSLCERFSNNNADIVLKSETKELIQTLFEKNIYKGVFESIEDVENFVKIKIQKSIMFKNASLKNSERMVSKMKKDNEKLEISSEIINKIYLIVKENYLDKESKISLTKILDVFIHETKNMYSRNTLRTKISNFLGCENQADVILLNLFDLFKKLDEIVEKQKEIIINNEKIESETKEFVEKITDFTKYNSFTEQNIKNVLIYNKVFESLFDFIDFDLEKSLAAKLLLEIENNKCVSQEFNDEIFVDLGFKNKQDFINFDNKIFNQFELLDEFCYFNQLHYVSLVKNKESNDTNIFNLFNSKINKLKENELKEVILNPSDFAIKKEKVTKNK